MAPPAGTSAARAVLDYLIHHGPRVAFLQALTLLERCWPDRPAIGEDGPPEEEPVRLRPSVSLSCPASDVESIKAARGDRLRITATFMGLYGVDGPLPYDYLERIAYLSFEAAGERIRDFLDILHHRLYSLLYRAWKKSRPVAATPRSGDPIYDRVLSVVGHSASLGLGGQRRPRLQEARLLAMQARTASGLQALLGFRLGYPCAIVQLQRRAAEVPPGQRTRLGEHHNQLGETLLAGRRIYDRNKIKIQIDAESFEQFEALLPEGADRRELDDVVHSYLRQPQDFEVEVSLATEKVPPWRLRRRLAIGRSLWLGPPRPRAVCRWPGRRSAAASQGGGQPARGAAAETGTP